jgi:flagellar motor switch protein FliG
MATEAPETNQLVPQRSAHLGGRQKAAILLVGLGPERAAEIFRHLTEDDIETLSLDMANLQQVPSEISNEIWSEMVGTCSPRTILPRVESSLRARCSSAPSDPSERGTSSPA